MRLISFGTALLVSKGDKTSKIIFNKLIQLAKSYIKVFNPFLTLIAYNYLCNSPSGSSAYFVGGINRFLVFSTTFLKSSLFSIPILVISLFLSNVFSCKIIAVLDTFPFLLSYSNA